MSARADAVRPVVLLALLLVGTFAVGAAARAPATAGSGARVLGPVASVVAVAVLGGCALIALWLVVLLARRARHRRRRRDDLPPMIVYRVSSPLAQVGMLAALGLLLTGAVLAAIHVKASPERARAPGTAVSGSAQLPAILPHSAPHGPATPRSVPLDLPIAALAAAAVAVLYLGYRYVHTRRAMTASELSAGDRMRAELADTISRAVQALTEQSTPREAIIACYRSMELSLAAAGIDKQRADTPEELLARASELGIALPSAAWRLTELFREARFSTHPMNPQQRQQALAALGELRVKVGAAP